MNIEDQLQQIPLDELFDQVSLQIHHHGIDPFKTRREYIFENGSWFVRIYYGDKTSVAYGNTLKDALVALIVQMSVEYNN